MKVLLVGSGGREHALAWKLRQSPRVTRVFVAPGNGGTALEGQNVPLRDDDVEALVRFAEENGVELAIPGPELPLVMGLADACERAGIECFGPSAYCAQLEGSKAFAKELMREAGIPTAAFAVFEDPAEALAHLESADYPLVVKADGLAAGKGVTVCRSKAEARQAVEDSMVTRIFGKAGDKVIVEEALFGEEASFLAFCDGQTYLPMTACQDHKAVGEGDTGPNTGGMGAYCPAPVLPEADYGRVGELVIRPVLETFAKRGHPFKGVLYAGLMMTAKGPMVLEYNVRFGDPECQPLLMRLESDLAGIMQACCRGSLAQTEVKWSKKSAVCVVLAAAGYPGSYPKGMEITGLEAAEALAGVKVFQAGTRQEDGKTLTSGGRVLGVTALGDGLAKAKEAAYQALERVRFDNSHHRRDIGDKGLRREAT